MAAALQRPIEQEHLRRNPDITVANRQRESGEFPRSGSPTFDKFGETFGRQALSAGILDEGVAQPQFGSPGNAKATVKSRPGDSLITSSNTKKRRKRISGFGKDNTSGSGGTVKKEELGGK